MFCVLCDKMGKLLSILARDDSNCCTPKTYDIFLDFENAAPTETEREVYDEVERVLKESDAVLDEIQCYKNGSLILGEHLDPLVVGRDEYCLAHLSDNSTGTFNTNVMFCTSTPDKETPQFVGQLIYPAVMLVTVIFLTLTLFVYLWIKDLRTLHGKTFMCYLASLIVGYSALAYSHISNLHAYRAPYLCLIIAEITHTAFIAGFIWLSIIGYDIWRAVGRANQRSHQFLKYCLFTCGTTFLIVLITNVLDRVDLLEEKFRPGLGISVCWLQELKFVNFLYLYSIIIIIITINTVFFILTKRKIEWAQKLSSYATEGEGSKKFSRDETDADRFQLFFRLIIIMGLPWLIEIISWLTGEENFIIYIVDTVTMLIGPVIFFISIKKPRIKRLMEERWTTMTTLRSNLSKLGVGNSATQSSNSTAK